MYRKKWMVLCFLCLYGVLLSGCVIKSADEMYCLPKQPQSYYDLQNAIDEVMANNMEYCAPTSGDNQQAVQLADIDGDGKNEALVFAKSTGERPLKILVFDKHGDAFENIFVIEGEGAAFDSVEYVQLDGEKGQEIVVGRRISDQVLRALSVYSVEDSTPTEVVSVPYAKYVLTDLTGDAMDDLVVLKDGASAAIGLADLYSFDGTRICRIGEASMSVGTQSMKRVISGAMTEEIQAIYVASAYGEDSIITDVFAMVDGKFVNVTGAKDTGISTGTVRSYYVYAEDLDGDGIVELPDVAWTIPVGDPEQGQEYIIRWCGLSPNGEKKVKQITYHNYDDGWYLILPFDENVEISVSHEIVADQTQAYIFYKWDDARVQAEVLFTLFACTGRNRTEAANMDGRFPIGEKNDVLYAAALGNGQWASEMTQEDIKELFQFIHIAWNTGKM